MTDSGEPRYPYVLVDVGADESDVASSELFDLGAQGVEERDQTTLVKAARPGAGEGSGGGVGGVTLVASFATFDEAREALVSLPAHWGPRIEEVVGDAWRDAWKEHFHPFEVCPGVVIRPPWEAYEKKADEVVLELEPGRAFGTGLHETTSLCAEVLASAAAPGVSGLAVLDVGCGSGILSLVALALGAATARAIDVDADAAAVTRENAARNGMAARVEADTTDITALEGMWPVVLANIEARVLVPMAEALSARVDPGGRLVLSGILAPQKDDVVRAYAALRHVETRVKGEWVALVLERGS